MTALGTNQFIDLGGHHLVHHFQANSGGCRQQALANVFDKGGQMPVEMAREAVIGPKIGGRDEIQVRGVALDGGDVRSLHSGVLP